MPAEADFQELADQVHLLLGSGTVHLLLGCPEPQLRHPLLALFPIEQYHYLAGVANPSEGHEAGGILSGGQVSQSIEGDINHLLHEEHVRALCDMAIQTGQVQISKQVSIAVAPLERPGGILGLILVTDPEAFSEGEHLLLSGFSTKVAQSLEERLLNLYSALLRPHLMEGKIASQTALQPTDITDGVIITHASDTLEQKEEFISIVRHELRMPLTSIKGYAALLQAYGIAGNHVEEMTPARQKRYLATIMEQVDHLEVLISDLLDMTRIQAGRLALHFTQVDVAQLCQRVAELAQQRVDHEQYLIRCSIDPHLSLAWADPDRLQQVLTNLVENAIKYSPEGGTIELLASAPDTATTDVVKNGNAVAPRVDARETGTPSMLSITICDQGIGISQQHQTLLFQPFSRLEHPATEQVPGAGLGLYIARKLVEAMHGNLALYSSEGEGTCVTLTLPCMPDEYSTPSLAMRKHPTVANR
jgi:signal transduction histidine kinase